MFFGADYFSVITAGLHDMQEGTSNNIEKNKGRLFVSMIEQIIRCDMMDVNEKNVKIK